MRKKYSHNNRKDTLYAFNKNYVEEHLDSPAIIKISNSLIRICSGDNH